MRNGDPPMVDIIRAYSKPEKYKEFILLEKIVVDEKVVDEGVARYEEMIESGGELKPIIVIKHPKEDLYAVLNGHHRFWALKEMKINKIKCAVIEDPLGILFNLTKDGFLQPTVELTQYFVVPLRKFEEQLNEFKKRRFNFTNS